MLSDTEGLMNKQLTKNFTQQQIICKCGCGYNNINMILMLMLQSLRTAYGKPINITSGCRCKKHNKNVGGVDNSSHVSGLAVDIAFKDLTQLYQLIKLAMTVGFKRIGINYQKKFIHLDIDDSKPMPSLFKY